MNSETASDLAARIDSLLPQTQCTRCGFAGCLPYATAIATGDAAINQCPPGGDSTIQALAQLLGVPEIALNSANGVAMPPRVAWIDESRCIGCARCLNPCPVDAIVGAQKFLHTIIADRCTGCELCLPPCPVDCIEMRDSPSEAILPALNRKRFEAHVARNEQDAAERRRQLAAKKAIAGPRPRP